MFDQNLNVVVREEISLPLESWSAIERCARDSGFATKAQLLSAIANNPTLLEKVVLHFHAKTVDYGSLFDTPVVRPMEPVTEVLTVIQIDGDTVKARHDVKNDDWIAVVKAIGYGWDKPFWYRDITPATNGSVIDRAAELGHRVLGAGFCVVFPNPDVRDIAIGGTYEPEHTRWVKAVTSGQHKDYFYLSWQRRDDCYDEAIKITGAKYSKPGIVVPPLHFDEVLDFASIHGFRFTESAQALVNRCKAWRESAMVVDIAEITDTSETLPDSDDRSESEGEYDVADELVDGFI